MKAVGKRRLIRSWHRLGSCRAPAVAALAGVIALLGSAHPGTLAAQRCGDQARGTTLNSNAKSPGQHTRAKHRRTAKKPLKKKSRPKVQAGTSGQHPARLAGKKSSTHRHAVLSKSKSKAKRHIARTQTKHHSSVRLAKTVRDPSKLIIPEGDGQPVIDVASRYLGRPYRFGSDHGAFDCSGFVRTVFAKVGVELPHSAREQFMFGDTVRRTNLEPGDLVFFRTYRHYATHVGIYVGDDKFVHAATRGGQVQVDSLSEHYYARRYLGARRLEI